MAAGIARMRRDEDLSTVNAVVFSGSKWMIGYIRSPKIEQCTLRCMMVSYGARLFL